MQTHFTTSDFPLAATLLTMGFKLDLLDRSNTQRIVFHFVRNEKIDEILEAFWKGEIRIEPKQFYLNQKLLKSRILENQ